MAAKASGQWGCACDAFLSIQKNRCEVEEVRSHNSNNTDINGNKNRNNSSRDFHILGSVSGLYLWELPNVASIKSWRMHPLHKGYLNATEPFACPAKEFSL